MRYIAPLTQSRTAVKRLAIRCQLSGNNQIAKYKKGYQCRATKMARYLLIPQH